MRQNVGLFPGWRLHQLKEDMGKDSGALPSPAITGLFFRFEKPVDISG
jgi:hypothetical protein